MVTRTLHLTNSYHASSGGVRTYYHALLDAANRERRHVVLVVPAEEDRVEHVGAYGRIYRLRAPRAPLFDRRYRMVYPHRFLRTGTGPVWRILREEQPEIVEIADKYSWCYLGGLIKRVRWAWPTPPMVLGVSHERMSDSMDTYVGGGLRGAAFARWYLRSVYLPLSDAHLANSSYTAGELADALPHVRRGSIKGRDGQAVLRVVPMGTHTGSLGVSRRSAVARAELSGGALVPGEIVLLYVGRLAPEKHIDLVLDALPHLPERFRLALAGDGPLAAALRERAAHSQGRLRLLGHIGSRERLAALYASADMLVHPNPREPFGISVVEAMASGLPVVAPAAGGVLSYASDENAWLVDPPTPRRFADTIQTAWTNADERQQRVQQALRTARRLDWVHVTRAVFRVYDELYDRFLSWEGVRPLPPTCDEAVAHG